jgi:hypothetical protein
MPLTNLIDQAPLQAFLFSHCFSSLHKKNRAVWYCIAFSRFAPPFLRLFYTTTSLPLCQPLFFAFFMPLSRRRKEKMTQASASKYIAFAIFL